MELAARTPTVQFGVFVATSTAERAAESRAALTALVAPAQIHLRIAELRDTRLPAEFDALKDHLGALAADPWDLVLAPHADDAHQDHALLGRLALTAFRDHLILRYEIPKWDGDLGMLRPNVYVPLSAAQIHRKWEVLDAHYTSQRSRDWWDFDTISALARLRGVECRSTYAEAFRADKMVLGLTPAR